MRLSRTPCTARAAAAALLLFGLLAAAKSPLVLSDVDAGLPEVTSRVRVAGLGVAPQVDLELASAQLVLGAGDTFTLTLDDGAALTGTFTRKSPSARSLRMELDAHGEEALLASLGARAADLVAPGAPVTEVVGSITKASLRVRLKLDKQAGTATARVAARFKVELGLQLAGPDDVPLVARLSLRGASEPFGLDVLLGD